MADARVLEEGTLLKHGTFRVTSLLASGGFGEVYRGRQERLGRDIAIKVLRETRADDEEMVLRFQREALAAGTLLHSNILPVLDFDFDEEQGVWFLALAYVPGGHTLLERVATPQTIEAILPIIKGLASGLDAAHAHEIVHRDVKPANVLMDGDRPLLTDFGIAHLGDRTYLTRAGSTIGTALYMAPEQWQGKATTARTDQYALAVIAYEMLAGRPPFVGNTDALFGQHVHVPPPPLESFGMSVGVAVEQVIDRALSKEPSDRFGSCGEFALALEAASHARQRDVLAARYEEGLRLWEARDLQGAITVMQEIQRDAPDYRNVDALVREIQAELDRVQARQERAAPLAAAVEQLVESGQPVAARELLGQFREQFPDYGGLAALAGQVTAANDIPAAPVAKEPSKSPRGPAVAQISPPAVGEAVPRAAHPSWWRQRATLGVLVGGAVIVGLLGIAINGAIGISRGTPSPRAAPTSAVASGPGAVLLEDNFDDPSRSTFPASSPDSGQSQRYVNGEYEIVNSRTGGVATVDVPGTYANTSIDIEARVMGGPDARGAFVRCRTNTESGESTWYQLTVFPIRQAFNLVAHRPADENLANQGSPAIAAGEALNRLSLTCAGSTISAAINGTVVATVQDTSFTSGHLEFGVAGDNATGRFDNLVVIQR